MTKQEDLKNKLINNEISKIDFLRALMSLDQETSDHKECFDNITIMEQENVKNIFFNNNEFSYHYFTYLRNFYFHSFQNLACKKDQKNIDKAIKYLEGTNNISEKLMEIDPEEFDLFTPYVSATLCYMKNDLGGLAIYLAILENANKDDMLDENLLLIKKLYKDLTKFKSSNYSRDF